MKTHSHIEKALLQTAKIWSVFTQRVLPESDKHNDDVSTCAPIIKWRFYTHSSVTHTEEKFAPTDDDGQSISSNHMDRRASERFLETAMQRQGSSAIQEQSISSSSTGTTSVRTSSGNQGSSSSSVPSGAARSDANATMPPDHEADSRPVVARKSTSGRCNGKPARKSPSKIPAVQSSAPTCGGKRSSSNDLPEGGSVSQRPRMEVQRDVLSSSSASPSAVRDVKQSVKTNGAANALRLSRKNLFKPTPVAQAAQVAAVSVEPFADCGKIVSKDLLAYPIYQKVDHCRHACSTKCKFSESEKAIETYCKVVHSPLVLPLLFGWWRELKRNPRAVPEDEGRVLYTSPCGVPIRNEEKLLDYLAKVESVLPTQVFSFEPAIELTNRFVVYKSRVKKFVEDISKNMLLPFQKIPVFNCYTEEIPEPFSYVKKYMRSAEVVRFAEDRKIEERTEGCACQGYCKKGCLCVNIYEEYDGYAAGRLYYKQQAIVECNVHCKCGPNCGNRVSTSTIPFPVTMFYYPAKGWGVRALCDIPAGTFMGFYYGQIITDAETSESGDKYLVGLDYEKSRTVSTKTMPGSATSNLTMNGEDDEYLNIDGHRFGSVARFFNHSCEPNLFAQVIHKECVSPRLYSVGFFTNQNIAAGDELCWDYAYDTGSIPDRSIQCMCGKPKCRVVML